MPSDPVLVHEIRLTLDQYHTTKRGLISTIEFITKFGANPIPVEQALSIANWQLKDVEEMFLLQDLEGSLQLAQKLIFDLHDATALAVKLKNQALLWTYTVEWLVVTSTMLTAGFVVWTLMIQRRRYSEMGTTRLGKTGILT